MDPAKLKVVELRSELAKLGLDTKGNKAALVGRLRKALDEQTKDPVEAAVPTDAQNENSATATSQAEKAKSPEPAKVMSPVKTPGRSARISVGAASTRTTPTRGSPKGVATPITQKSSPTKSAIVDKPQSPIPEPQVPTAEETPSIKPAEGETKSELTVVPEDPVVEQASEHSEPEMKTPQVAEEAPDMKPAPDKVSMDSEPVATVPTIIDDVKPTEKPQETILPVPEATDKLKDIENIAPEDPEEKKIISDACTDDVPAEVNKSAIAEELEEKMEMNEVNENASVVTADALDLEEDDKDLQQEEVNKKTEIDESESMAVHDGAEVEDIEMTPLSSQDDADKDDVEKDSKEDRRDRKDRKRKRSTSSQDERHRSPPPSKTDDEPDIDYSRVLLSWYDSDLNLVIDKSKFLSATPMHNDGFGYMWAGARAAFGFKSGKIYYEAKITHQCNVSLQDEEHPHVFRAGWSVASASLQLGEEKFSYGYDSTGKISTEDNFKDYGPTFGLNDILGCYLDMAGEEEEEDDIVVSYTLNGENLGEAFKVPKAELKGKALFPHVLTKNCAFVCNFGDEDAWTENKLEGYTPVGQMDVQDRVCGPRRPEKREDCEVLMMCGLPGVGKTVWATKHASEQPEKMYNVLGTTNLIDKVQAVELPKKRTYHGRWEALIDKCLSKLLEVAATRRRNYILDQTNVYATPQRRKMRHFYGFQRKAIVIVPTEEEFKSRTAKREAIEGKDVPESGVLEMKANFSVPTVGESFEAVEWVELDEEEGKKLIAKYNKEGKDAGFVQQTPSKRPRCDKSDSYRDSRDARSNRDSRDSRDYRDRRSSYSDRNRNSMWRGGNHMGGHWRDRVQRYPSYPRHSSSGYGSPSSSWRGRGPPQIASHRGGDRRLSSSSGDRRSVMPERRSSVSRQGGTWGPMNSNSSYHNSHSSGGWGGSWAGQSQQQGNWSNSQSGNWGGQQNWGQWKSYGQSGYSQNNYSQQQQQQNYGNGNWGSWNEQQQQQQQQQQQYYNQYWNQQSSSQGQSATSGQSALASGTTSGSSAASAGSTYNSYPQGWQGYTQSYYSTDSSNSSTSQQK